MRSIITHSLIALGSIALTFGLVQYINKPEKKTDAMLPDTTGLPESCPLKIRKQSIGKYVPMSFDFEKIEGLSAKQLSDHNELYKGYVNKHNEIIKDLAAIDGSKSASSYSEFRCLKIGETFALNGTILHELYFENLAAHTTMGSLTKTVLEKHFGSVEKYKADLFASAKAARGWAITGYCLFDGSLRNFVLDAHNETVPLLTIPLIVVDTYEHAYMIDYGINRAAYLDVIWKNINWDVIETRISSWVGAHAMSCHRN